MEIKIDLSISLYSFLDLSSVFSHDDEHVKNRENDSHNVYYAYDDSQGYCQGETLESDHLKAISLLTVRDIIYFVRQVTNGSTITSMFSLGAHQDLFVFHLSKLPDLLKTRLIACLLAKILLIALDTECRAIIIDNLNSVDPASLNVSTFLKILPIYME